MSRGLRGANHERRKINTPYPISAPKNIPVVASITKHGNNKALESPLSDSYSQEYTTLANRMPPMKKGRTNSVSPVRATKLRRVMSQDA